MASAESERQQSTDDGMTIFSPAMNVGNNRIDFAEHKFQNPNDRTE